jgi:hypothetical protein
VESGNLFIETESSAAYPGWALTAECDYRIFYLPQTEIVYQIPTERLRELLPEWQRRFNTRTSWSGAVGITVPLAEVAHEFVTIRFKEYLRSE